MLVCDLVIPVIHGETKKNRTLTAEIKVKITIRFLATGKMLLCPIDNRQSRDYWSPRCPVKRWYIEEVLHKISRSRHCLHTWTAALETHHPSNYHSFSFLFLEWRLEGGERKSVRAVWWAGGREGLVVQLYLLTTVNSAPHDFNWMLFTDFLFCFDRFRGMDIPVFFKS